MNFRSLNWGKSCFWISNFKLQSIYINILWNHFTGGIRNYIYPEINSSEIIRIKNKYNNGRIIIIPILRDSWIVNTGTFGWKEIIKYEGSSNKTVDLDDKGRKAIVLYLSDLKKENIKKFLTIECTREDVYKELEGKRVYLKKKIIPKRLPLYFILEGYNGNWGIVNLWNEDYTDPKIIFSTVRGKKKAVFHLLKPDNVEWIDLNDHQNILKDFLEP